MSRQSIGFLAFVAICLILIPLFFHSSRYFLNVMVLCSILSLIAMGVWLTFMLGLVNIGQAAFCTIGAYTTAILSVRYGIPFWICLPISGFTAALIGGLIGLSILRLKGVYFAMVTICLGEAVRLAFMNGGRFSGGPDGILGVPRPGAIFIGGQTIIPAFKPDDYLSFYFLAVTLLIAGVVVIRRLDRSRVGRTFKAIRQTDTLALSVGINVAKYRVIGFGVSCFIGGTGGSFFAAYMTTIYPNSFTIWDSIYFMLYCYLGGLGHIFGPVVGAFILVGSFEAMRFVIKQEYQALVYACIMIVTILWMPNGLLGIKWHRKTKVSADVLESKSV
jgi:branched-chain amino acid transport system permease protein